MGTWCSGITSASHEEGSNPSASTFAEPCCSLEEETQPHRGTTRQWQCKGNAETRDRTGYLQIFSVTLSQLSYRGRCILTPAFVMEDNNTNSKDKVIHAMSQTECIDF